MLSLDTLDLMKKLTQAMGISGDEKEVSQLLQVAYAPYADELIFDNLGSVFALKKSKNPQALTVMVAGHMDEVGFIVNSINEKGSLGISPVGGWWSQVLLSQRVIVKTRDNKKIKGTIGSIPPHLLSEKDRNAPIEIKHMLVDIGCSSKAEVEALNIGMGCSMIIDGPFEVLQNGQRLMSKAWDNRYGCILGVELLKALKDIELDVHVVIGATVQEEVGTRGAQTSTYKIKPDMAIVLDCSPANDASGDKDGFGQLGQGPLVRFIDANYLPHRGFLEHYMDLLDREKIPYQFYQSLGGTDAGTIHKQFAGIPTLTQCICARNLHSNSTIIDAQDYLHARTAVLKMLESLNSVTIETIKKANQ